jgi:hypothetical protein
MRIIFTFIGLLILAMETTSVSAAEAKREEAVIIHFKYGQKDWSRFFAFEKVIEEAISKSAVGDYDGNELATDGSDGTKYMYGPSADALFAVAKPYLLSAAQFLKSIEVTLRYGPVAEPGVRVSKIQLTP